MARKRKKVVSKPPNVASKVNFKSLDIPADGLSYLTASSENVSLDLNYNDVGEVQDVTISLGDLEKEVPLESFTNVLRLILNQ